MRKIQSKIVIAFGAFSFPLSQFGSAHSRSNLFLSISSKYSFFIVFAQCLDVFLWQVQAIYITNLDQYWHNYKGDEFFCSFMLSLSLTLSSTLFFIIHFVYRLILYTLLAARYHFFSFRIVLHFALKLYFSSMYFKCHIFIQPLNQCHCAGDISDRFIDAFFHKHNHFLSEANQNFIACTFFVCAHKCIQLIFWQRKIHFHRIFSKSLAIDGVEFIAINIKLLLLFVTFFLLREKINIRIFKWIVCKLENINFYVNRDAMIAIAGYWRFQ